MEKNKINTKKKDATMFAFLPEMVIKHINQSGPQKFKTIPNDEKNDEKLDTAVSQSVVFDPLADPFDGINIEIEPIKKSKKKQK